MSSGHDLESAAKPIIPLTLEQTSIYLSGQRKSEAGSPRWIEPDSGLPIDAFTTEGNEFIMRNEAERIRSGDRSSGRSGDRSGNATRI